MTHQPARGGSDETRGAAPGSTTDREPAAHGPIALSRTVLIWERLEVAFWKPAAFAFLFLAIALTGALSALDPYLHSAVLAAAAAVFLWLTLRGARGFRLPDTAIARRRIETANGLEHRPLETLADRPSADDPTARAVWDAHRRRVLARLKGLSAGAPEPQLARRDPRGLRIAAVFFAVVALAAAGSRAPERLESAFLPAFASPETQVALAIDAWLAPPDYTGLPPQFITRSVPNAEGPADAVGPDHAAPVGSRLVVQVTGPVERAELVTPAGTKPMPTFAQGGVAIEHEIETTGPVSVVADGRTLAEWTIRATPDAPPEVALTDTPVPSLQQALTIFHSVSDDYGIAGLRAEIERADRPAGSAQSSAFGEEEMTIVTPLPIPDAARYGEDRRVYRDFTAHPWAGGEVTLTLVATDAIGQETRTEPVTIILPGKIFEHPVAQIIVELRRELAWDPVRNFRNVADALEAVAWAHENYDDDPTVFLSLREAARRLLPGRRGDGTPTPETVGAVVDQLWKTALYLEDGGVSLALARLRAAEQALMEALAEGADQAELERLMDELQSAMNDYMQAMTEQLRDRVEQGEEVPQIGPEGNMISSQDIDEMMEKLREMMRNGMTESAAQMLENLRRMMENMQAGVQQQMSPENQQAMDMLRDMRDVMQSQRELMDRTHRRAQEGQQGQQNQQGQQGEGEGQQGQQQGQNGQGQQGGPGSADAVLQDALRRQFGEIMRQFGEMMGEIPDSFGRADESMGDAAQRLGEGDPSSALGPQGEAMDALQDATEDARSAFMERFEQQLGMGQQTPGASGQQTMDPFGRQASETFRGPMQGEVSVPDEGGLERARRIRDELRRRAGERGRPDSELDYIDRLLDQFE